MLLFVLVLALRHFGDFDSYSLREQNSRSTPYSASGAGEEEMKRLENEGAYLAPVGVEERGEAPNESESELQAGRVAVGITEESLASCMKEQEGRYMYDMMDPDLHRLYAEIFMCLMAHGENILLSTTDADDLQTAFLCVFQDHPELYWMDGYSYRRFGRGNNLSLTFSGRYTYSADDCRLKQPLIDGYVSRCLSGIPFNADDYEKVKYIYEYIIRSTDYQIGAADNQNILSVFLNGQSVCQGYAKALQYLLYEVDVPCTMVVGMVNGGEGHAWDLVCVEGAYYFVDPTWGDTGYLAASGAAVNFHDEVNYNYLNVTTEEISLSHTADNVIPMPRCVATVDNYYVREDRYFDHYDRLALKELFDEAAFSGSGQVSFKCSDAACYEHFTDELLTDKQIFTLLPEGRGAVDYTTDPDLRVLSFWF
ncbi:MAG: hypothetical protein IK115_11570 [Lachnospiraceae bacterium]|nr:hypothetical protein [Lachnospiraceae bacterium]